MRNEQPDQVQHQDEHQYGGGHAFEPSPAAKELLELIAELLAQEYIDLLEKAAEQKTCSDPPEGNE